MNIIFRNEIEQLILEARKMTKEKFEETASKYLAQISEREMDEFREALASLHIDRIRQLVEIDKELAMLRQSDTIEEMAEIEC